MQFYKVNNTKKPKDFSKLFSDCKAQSLIKRMITQIELTEKKNVIYNEKIKNQLCVFNLTNFTKQAKDRMDDLSAEIQADLEEEDNLLYWLFDKENNWEEVKEAFNDLKDERDDKMQIILNLIVLIDTLRESKLVNVPLGIYSYFTKIKENVTFIDKIFGDWTKIKENVLNVVKNKDELLKFVQQADKDYLTFKRLNIQSKKLVSKVTDLVKMDSSVENMLKDKIGDKSLEIFKSAFSFYQSENLVSLVNSHISNKLTQHSSIIKSHLNSNELRLLRLSYRVSRISDYIDILLEMRKLPRLGEPLLSRIRDNCESNVFSCFNSENKEMSTIGKEYEHTLYEPFVPTFQISYDPSVIINYLMGGYEVIKIFNDKDNTRPVFVFGYRGFVKEKTKILLSLNQIHSFNDKKVVSETFKQITTKIKGKCPEYNKPEIIAEIKEEQVYFIETIDFSISYIKVPEDKYPKGLIKCMFGALDTSEGSVFPYDFTYHFSNSPFIKVDSQGVRTVKKRFNYIIVSDLMVLEQYMTAFSNTEAIPFLVYDKNRNLKTIGDAKKDDPSFSLAENKPFSMVLFTKEARDYESYRKVSLAKLKTRFCAFFKEHYGGKGPFDMEKEEEIETKLKRIYPSLTKSNFFTNNEDTLMLTLTGEDVAKVAYSTVLEEEKVDLFDFIYMYGQKRFTQLTSVGFNTVILKFNSTSYSIRSNFRNRFSDLDKCKSGILNFEKFETEVKNAIMMHYLIFPWNSLIGVVRKTWENFKISPEYRIVEDLEVNKVFYQKNYTLVKDKVFSVGNALNLKLKRDKKEKDRFRGEISEESNWFSEIDECAFLTQHYLVFFPKSLGESFFEVELNETDIRLIDVEGSSSDSADRDTAIMQIDLVERHLFNDTRRAGISTGLMKKYHKAGYSYVVFNNSDSLFEFYIDLFHKKEYRATLRLTFWQKVINEEEVREYKTYCRGY